MRLRHKKPINSYVGQANLDSNEVLDEDFDKNNAVGKRPKTQKQTATNDSVRKYADILVNFVRAINTDYNSYIRKFPTKSKTQDNPKAKETPIDANISKKSNFGEHLSRKSQVVLKQQQKLQQKNKVVAKEIKKIKSVRAQEPSKKESSFIPRIPTTEPSLAKPQKSASKRQQIDLTGENDVLQNKNAFSTPKKNQLKPNPPMFQNQGYPGNINPALFQNLQYQIPIYQQLFNEQMKQNPNYMMLPQPYQIQNFQNFFSMFGMPNLPSMQNNYIPFSKLPFFQEKKQDKEKQPKIDPIPLNRQTPQKKNIPLQNKAMNNGFFNKKSCTHVAIAYHIHLEKLKSNGKINNSNSGHANSGLQELDPTFAAKKIRTRKNSEIIFNPQPKF